MNDVPEHPLFAAIKSADVSEIERLAGAGVDLNLRNGFGEPALFAAIELAQFTEDAAERAVCLALAQRLLALGADINGLDEDGASILIGPIFGLHHDIVSFLLEAGVDPNNGCSGEAWEPVYDAASFDYDFEAWYRPSLPALDPPDGLIDDEDAYLSWLDREASRRGYLKPDILLTLRKHGALTAKELAVQLGGTPDRQVRWTAEGWTLAD